MMAKVMIDRAIDIRYHQTVSQIGKTFLAIVRMIPHDSRKHVEQCSPKFAASLMKTTISVVFVFLFFTFFSSNAFACTCGGITQGEEFRRSESVFVGKFIRQTETGVELKIIKSWKGAKAGKIITLSYFELDGCDYDLNFVRGKKYLICAVRSAELGLFVSADCGRSRGVEDIKNMSNVAKGK